MGGIRQLRTHFSLYSRLTLFVSSVLCVLKAGYSSKSTFTGFVHREQWQRWEMACPWVVLAMEGSINC